jgi:SecD/SecF fusion protein
MWVLIGVWLMVASRAIFFSSARYSEEFTGWVSLWVAWQLETETVKAWVEQYLTQENYEDIKVSVEAWAETTVLKIHTKVANDEMVAELSKKIQWYLLESETITSADEIVQQTITWPSVWSYMQKAALRALIVGLIFIIVYMMFSFSAIRTYISPLILAFVTIGTMIFDISIPAWAYGIWMSINSTIQIDTIFIIAILTTMWYSINDTIVIFDRIRENLQNKGTGKDISHGKVFEDSLWQTMRRSIGTSVSTLLVVAAMFIFGSGVIKGFAFAIWVWVIAGSYSSIFIAAPLAYIISGKWRKNNKNH